MYKRTLNKLQKISVDYNRLTDNREQYPLEWLLGGKELGSFDSYGNNLNRIKSAIRQLEKKGCIRRELVHSPRNTCALYPTGEPLL